MNGQEIVGAAIDRVNAEPDAPGLSKDPGTALLGPDAAIDSLGLVSLIVAVEQLTGEALGRQVALADEISFDADGNPFATVGAMTAHVNRLLES